MPLATTFCSRARRRNSSTPTHSSSPTIRPARADSGPSAQAASWIDAVGRLVHAPTASGCEASAALGAQRSPNAGSHPSIALIVKLANAPREKPASLMACSLWARTGTKKEALHGKEPEREGNVDSHPCVSSPRPPPADRSPRYGPGGPVPGRYRIAQRRGLSGGTQSLAVAVRALCPELGGILAKLCALPIGDAGAHERPSRTPAAGAAGPFSRTDPALSARAAGDRRHRLGAASRVGPGGELRHRRRRTGRGNRCPDRLPPRHPASAA